MNTSLAAAASELQQNKLEPINWLRWSLKGMDLINWKIHSKHDYLEYTETFRKAQDNRDFLGAKQRSNTQGASQQQHCQVNTGIAITSHIARPQVAFVPAANGNQ